MVFVNVMRLCFLFSIFGRLTYEFSEEFILNLLQFDRESIANFMNSIFIYVFCFAYLRICCDTRHKNQAIYLYVELEIRR